MHLPEHLHNAALQLIKHSTLRLAVNLDLLCLDLALGLSILDSLVETVLFLCGGHLALVRALGDGNLMLVEILHGSS